MFYSHLVFVFDYIIYGIFMEGLEIHDDAPGTWCVDLRVKTPAVGTYMHTHTNEGEASHADKGALNLSCFT